MRRAELTVLIHAWLEEQDLFGLDPAFRARITLHPPARTVGVSSIEDLHRKLDVALTELVGGREGCDAI